MITYLQTWPSLSSSRSEKFERVMKAACSWAISVFINLTAFLLCRLSSKKLIWAFLRLFFYRLRLLFCSGYACVGYCLCRSAFYSILFDWEGSLGVMLVFVRLGDLDEEDCLKSLSPAFLFFEFPVTFSADVFPSLFFSFLLLRIFASCALVFASTTRYFDPIQFKVEPLVCLQPILSVKIIIYLN